MNTLLEKLKKHLSDLGEDKKYYTIMVLSDDKGSGHFKEEHIDFMIGNAAHDSYSVSKSVAALAAGILYDEKRLFLQDKIEKWLGDFLTPQTDTRWGDITIDELMRHRTGAASGVDFYLEEAEKWQDPEWLHTLFATPICKIPGQDFTYSDGNYYILSRIVEKICGMDLDAFLQQKVFSPLGLHQNAWSRDGAGHTLGGTGLYLRTIDMAKIG